MPNKARNLQITASGNCSTLKPEPPDDLWEQMDRLNAEYNMPSMVIKTSDMFNAVDYARRYNMSPSSACDRLRKLADLGEIEFVGIGLNNAKFYRIKKS